MMKKTIFTLLIGTLVVFGTSCNQDGCIDPTALNYDPSVEKDDGSCVYLADNLNFKFYSKMGGQDFAFNTDVQASSGRMMKFTRAQMYLSGFKFNGNGGTYEVLDPYLMLKAGVEDYDLGYLPVATFDGFSFSAGVDSIANHTDPALWPSDNALSANNPDHMHWGWLSGQYIFFKIEGLVDTSAAMDGDVNAPFVFHIGLDANRVDVAFTKQVVSVEDGVTIELDVDWLQFLNGMDMTADPDTRVSHTMDNVPLSDQFVSNAETVFSLH